MFIYIQVINYGHKFNTCRLYPKENFICTRVSNYNYESEIQYNFSPSTTYLASLKSFLPLLLNSSFSLSIVGLPE